MSPGPEFMYAAHPTKFPEVQTLEELGPDFIDVNPDMSYGGLFEELSWEHAGKYDADVIMVDARATDETIRQLEGVGTWQNLPDVKAGQVYEWKTTAPLACGSQEGDEAILDDLDRSGGPQHPGQCDGPFDR